MAAVKLPPITIQSGGRFIPLGGSSRNYIDLWNPQATKPLSRRQVDNILHQERGYFERKAKRNKAENPDLQKQRPARGRKSTQPKNNTPKTHKRKGKSKSNYYRTYKAPGFEGVESWLKYHRNSLYWYAVATYKKPSGELFDNTILGAQDFANETIDAEIEMLREIAMTQRGPDGSYEMISATFYVTVRNG